MVAVSVLTQMTIHRHRVTPLGTNVYGNETRNGPYARFLRTIELFVAQCSSLGLYPHEVSLYLSKPLRIGGGVDALHGSEQVALLTE